FVAPVGASIEAPYASTVGDGGIVGIRDHRALWADAMAVANHGEQRMLLAPAVDDPFRVEDLVPAMLGIRLREHHQLDVGRIAAGMFWTEIVGEIIDLVGRECQSESAVRVLDRGAPSRAEVDGR